MTTVEGTPLASSSMRRLVDLTGLDDVSAGVVSGPGDLETWEVCATVRDAPVPVQIVGRGADVDAAASCLLAALAHHFPAAHREQAVISDEE